MIVIHKSNRGIQIPKGWHYKTKMLANHNQTFWMQELYHATL